jgi:hypothetical protein
MALIDPFGLLDLDQSLDIHQHCLPIFVFGIQQQHLDAVEHFPIGRSVEDERDLPRTFIQVAKGFLGGMESTPGWVATY